MRWGPHLLRAPADLVDGTGSTFRWAVLPANVLLMRHDKPWGTHLEKPVPAVVAEVIELGAEAVIWLRPASIQNAQLQMRLPTRAVHRHAVVPGTAVTVCLRAADIIPSGEEPEWAGL